MYFLFIIVYFAIRYGQSNEYRWVSNSLLFVLAVALSVIVNRVWVFLNHNEPRKSIRVDPGNESNTLVREKGRENNFSIKERESWISLLLHFFEVVFDLK